jgi:acyl carrier protein
MTRGEVEAKVRQALSSVAPEIEVATLAPDEPLRGQVDLDSMDFLRFIVEIHKQLGVTIPEADYARLSSLSAVTDYLLARR